MNEKVVEMNEVMETEEKVTLKSRLKRKYEVAKPWLIVGGICVTAAVLNGILNALSDDNDAEASEDGTIDVDSTEMSSNFAEGNKTEE